MAFEEKIDVQTDLHDIRTAAIKNFENALGRLCHTHNDIGLGVLQSTSALISGLASLGEASMWNKDWYAVDGPDEAFNAMIDKQYEPEGAWRMGLTRESSKGDSMIVDHVGARAGW